MVAGDIPRTVKVSHSLHEISSAGRQKEEGRLLRAQVQGIQLPLSSSHAPSHRAKEMAHTEPMPPLLYQILDIQDPVVPCSHVPKHAQASSGAPSSKDRIMFAFKPA